MKTWTPWNPVKTKNEVPNVLSLMLKKELKYSINCKKVNNTPNIAVAKRAKLNLPIFPRVRFRCLMVTVTPDLRRTIVLIRGTLRKLNISTPTGGHSNPSSREVARKK